MSDTSHAPAALPLVLVVDDDRDSRAFCAFHLIQLGYRFAAVGNGQNALDRATELVPNVVRTHLALLGSDGWDLVRQLKSDERTAHVPVIAMTDAPAEDDQAWARFVGCDGFVRMPIDPEVLGTEMAQVLECMARESEASQ